MASDLVNNANERLNPGSGAADVVGIFPDRGAITRLVGAVLADTSKTPGLDHHPFSSIPL